jgi:hypothetical protein
MLVKRLTGKTDVELAPNRQNDSPTVKREMGKEERGGEIGGEKGVR